MSFAFYIYTTIIMGVALVTSAVALVVWLMTHRRDSLVAAAGFLLYMLDMSVIFFDEYTRLKYDYAVTFSEPLQHPLLRCVLGIAIYACIVLWDVLPMPPGITGAEPLVLRSWTSTAQSSFGRWHSFLRFA